MENTQGGVFFTFFKLYKCYQIAQRISLKRTLIQRLTHSPSNVPILQTMKTPQKTKDFLFSGGINWSIGVKLVIKTVTTRRCLLSQVFVFICEFQFHSSFEAKMKLIDQKQVRTFTAKQTWTSKRTELHVHGSKWLWHEVINIVATYW